MTTLTTTSNVKGISPDAISKLLILPVEAASVAMQASTIIATDATRTHIPLVTADPSAAWVAEGEEIGATDPSIDDYIATPAKIAGLSIITNELAADTSPAAAEIVGDGLARDIAKKIDLAYFGTKGSSLIQPAGLEDLAGYSLTVQETAWEDLDPFEEAISNAAELGLEIGTFAAHPDDALALAILKESTGSKRGLLTADATASTRKILAGVKLLASPGVRPGTIWGIPKVRSIIVRRNDVDLQTDKSAYFTSDRTAIRATMRLTFAFPQAPAIQRIMLGSTGIPTNTSGLPSGAATGAEVTLVGTNYTGTTSITVGGVDAPVFTVVSATSLKFTMPAGSAGSAPIVVTNNKGASTGLTYTRG